jgi:peptide-methionine (R)-S-oxide reductase
MPTYRRNPDAISRLSAEQYRVTQQCATEYPGTGEYLDNKEPSIYVDVVSSEPLFASSDKFDSGSGWPSFTKPVDPANVNERPDGPHTEVRSTHGDSDLGRGGVRHATYRNHGNHAGGAGFNLARQ